MPTRLSATRSAISQRRSHAMQLAGLLVGTLALATMLAYEAHDATRSHRATVERALHDYAEVAAWELVAATGEVLQSSLGSAFGPLTKTHASSPYELLPAPSVLAAGADGVLRCGNPAADSVRLYFRYDYRDGSLATTGAASGQLRRWISDTLLYHGRATYQQDWEYALVFDSGEPSAHTAIAYSLKFTDTGVPLAAYGIRTCADVASTTLIKSVLARHELLPTAVAAGAPNDSVVAIVLRDAHGRQLFQSNALRSPYSATVSLAQVGALTAQATILPHAVDQLALGALSGTRVPVLVGLLVLTAAMVAVTIAQLKREQELARLRADFISSVSHELRTPLSQILLFAETLNLGRVRTEAERQSATDVIVQEGRRLMHLVENILHFSRAERQMTRLGLEPLDLSIEVQTILDDWRPLAAAADARIDTHFEKDILAMADRAALRQMILNLLDNAVKYGPPAQTVSIGVGPGALPDRVRAWVDDEGRGIPVSERERVWASFYRLDRDANSSVAGSGIGLYVVRELARLHGGDAWIEDAPRGGARFVVELRAATRASGFTNEYPITITAARDVMNAEPRE